MHCVFSYDLTASGERRTEIETDIDRIIKPYRWAKRLTTFYIIEIKSKDNWDYLLKQLQNYGNGIPEKFHFIMSPPMSGGRYNGALLKGEWDFINEITSNS